MTQLSWAAGRVFSSFQVLVTLAVLGSVTQSVGRADVLTKNYDNQRTGANLSETILNQSNVNASTFGKLFQINVDDQVYAGLLYVANLSILGGTHNVVYVATVNNTVYAFDADTGAPLWQQNFNGAGRPTMASEVGHQCVVCCGGYHDFTGNIGIVGTPVIDRSSNAMFFVTRTVETGGTIQRLHSIDITTGVDLANSPRTIQATVAGTGDGGTTVAFAPLMQNQRPALALSQGIVYAGWASYCDTTPFHGWMMGFNEVTLAPTGVFNTTPNGTEGGIWMAGGGPVFDSFGNMYLATGNGSVDQTGEFGQAVVRLSPGTLQVQDSFTPEDYAALNAADSDVGSVAPTFVPGTNLLVEGSKQGLIFLLNSLNLGNLGGDANIPQYFQAVQAPRATNTTHHIHTQCVMWNSPQGMNLYVWGENDYARAFRFNGSTFNVPAVAVSSVLPPLGMPGGMITLSANGSTPGTGILWGTTPLAGDANKGTVPGIFYAFNAETMQLLWSSAAAADNTMNFAKFNNPIVQNGKVYVPSFSNIVSVYGLKQLPTATPAFTLAPGTYTYSQLVGITDNTPNASIYYTLDGTPPTASSTLYTGPITVSWGATVNAMALAPGALPSSVISGTYSINRVLASPSFNPASGNYSAGQTFTLTGDPSVCPKTTCTMYFTANGTAPTTGSTLYGGPVAIPAGTTAFRAIVTAPHYTASAATAATYTTPAATPSFSPQPGIYTYSQAVKISDASAGATVYYTLDGTAPTASSTQYTGPINVLWDSTIKAIAQAPGAASSAAISGTFSIYRQLAAPTFTPAAGTFTGTQTIALKGDPNTCGSTACTIYFTLNGTTPTTASTKYTGPFTIAASATTVVNAITTASHYTSSAVATATYVTH